jgi:hypothetical protein
VQRPIRSAPFNEGAGERSAVLVLFSSTEREMGLVIRELLDWLWTDWTGQAIFDPSAPHQSYALPRGQARLR